jgi:hypothetical protein
MAINKQTSVEDKGAERFYEMVEKIEAIGYQGVSIHLLKTESCWWLLQQL